MMTTATDHEKVEAIYKALNMGAGIYRRVNSPRGWNAAAQKTLERSVRDMLRTVLEREPTPEEIAQAARD